MFDINNYHDNPVFQVGNIFWNRNLSITISVIRKIQGY